MVGNNKRSHSISRLRGNILIVFKTNLVLFEVTLLLHKENIISFFGFYPKKYAHLLWLAVCFQKAVKF